MKTTSLVILCLTCAGTFAMAAPRSKTKAVKDLAVAAKDADFGIQGEYAATTDIGSKAEKGQYGLQVVALGDGNFQAALYKGGLPGSGAENNEFVLLTGSTEGGKTTLKAKSGETVVIKGGTATGTQGEKKLFVYDRVERQSPTLGKKAPKGAKVLFGGVEMDRFSGGTKLDGGLLEEGVVSLDSFGDFTLHLEFRTPYKPKTKPGNQDRTVLELASSSLSLALTDSEIKCS